MDDRRFALPKFLGVSPRFAEMWAARDVEVRRRIVKRVDHPLTGPLEFECQVLHVPDTDQRLIVYCTAPGSPTREAFCRADVLARSHDAMSPNPHRPCQVWNSSVPTTSCHVPVVTPRRACQAARPHTGSTPTAAKISPTI